MDLKSIGEISEASGGYEKGKMEETSFDAGVLEKYDRLMGEDMGEEDIVKENNPSPEPDDRLSPEEMERKLENLFEEGDFFEEREEGEANNEGEETDREGENSEGPGEHPESQEKEKGREGENTEGPVVQEESKEEEAEEACERDDDGKVYKKNGELLPDSEYTVNGNTYQTDGKGRIKTCDAKPRSTEEGSRDLKEQREAGGEERQKEDDGGHIIARVLGGTEGGENLVPMRRTINRGDYKKMENEIGKALEDGKDVTMHIQLEYDGDSRRPSRIRVEYTIDGKKTVAVFDNEENSARLLDSLEQEIDSQDYENLKQEIADGEEDGRPTTITSVKTEYDENGNPQKVTVRLLDESTGEKTEKVYQLGREA